MARSKPDMPMPAPPTLSGEAGLFTISWPDGISMRVDHLHPGRSTVLAEVRTYYQPAGTPNPGHLHQGTLNLLSTSGKDELARHLTWFVNSHNWPVMVEQMAVKIIERFRQSESPIQIGQLHSRTTPKWRLQYVAPEGEVAVLFGHGESNKSTFALACGLAVQHNWDGLGLTPVQGNVLYLDWEASPEEMNDRCLMLESGMEMDFHPNLTYQHCIRPLVDDIDEVQQLVKTRGIKFVIVDSAVKAAGGEKEAKENSGPTLLALRSLKCSVLIIAHHSKDPDSPKSPFGSVFWTNDPRHVLEVRTPPIADTEADYMDVGIYRYKSNVISKMAPLSYRVEWSELGITINKIAISESAQLKSILPAKSKIYEFLRAGPASIPKISVSCGLSEDTTRKALHRGQLQQTFVSLPNSDNPKTPLWAIRSREV